MFTPIKESDWKKFRPLREEALNRYCQRVLAEVSKVTADETKTPHERYLSVCKKKLIDDRDHELAETFNGLSRSKALLQLILIKRLGLVTEDELNCFSEETREAIRKCFA